MLKKTAVLLLAVMMSAAITGGALDVTMGVLGTYSSFTYVNTLIDAFSQDSMVDVPNLHSGIGISCDVGVWSPLERLRIGVGGMGQWAGLSTRAATVQSTLLGLYGWARYAAGWLDVSLSFVGSRGTFSFPEHTPYGVLHGMGGGVVARVSYLGLRIGALEAGGALALQWLPIGEMTDQRAQVYRGRGVPFLDFSGVSVSLDVRWQSRRRETPQ